MTPEQKADAEARLAEHRRVVNQTKLMHPMPWRYVTLQQDPVSPQAQLVMVDAANQQIQLFEMLDFCVSLSHVMQSQAAQKEPQAA